MIRPTESVFICHASEDKGRFVRGLASDLERVGADVWVDEWEIGPGESLRQRILEGIERCRFFLVVLSRRSIQKPWVQWELDAATIKSLEKTTEIVPIVYGTVSFGEVPLDLRAKRGVAFPTAVGRRYEASLDELLRITGRSAARWRLDLIGSGYVDLLAPRRGETRPEVAWHSHTNEYLDSTLIRTWYDVFVNGFTLESACEDALVVDEPRSGGARIEECGTPQDGRVLSLMSEVSGSPRNSVEDDSGYVLPGERSGLRHHSRRVWKAQSDDYAIRLEPGARASCGIHLGSARTVVVEETGELLSATCGGLLADERLSAFVVPTADQIVRGVMHQLEGVRINCPVRFERVTTNGITCLPAATTFELRLEGLELVDISDRQPDKHTSVTEPPVA